MINVLLDGKLVTAEAIDPKKHRYIGMFRFPFKIPADKTGKSGVIACDCGSSLWTVDQCLDHWHKGHWDVPQYETKGEEK